MDGLGNRFISKFICCLIVFLLFIPCAFSEEFVDSSALDFSEITVITVPNPDRYINVYIIDAKEKYDFGDALTLAAELVGYEWCDSITYQWQIYQNGTWNDIEGANELEYTITVTKENCLCEWRIQLTCFYN